ncbi:hypothetical protein K4200_02305 [Enterococcus faecalis]|nr:hypothetical protein [Enterococcus faecalis]EIW2091061.1 hypothetical protein [Enterococcus faecalis]QZT50141.1 hypothetical protein K4200_02305 [Enterococcus faecalis]HAP3644829.1 hypothetical protein [Enterococcus faecalis]
MGSVKETEHLGVDNMELLIKFGNYSLVETENGIEAISDKKTLPEIQIKYFYGEYSAGRVIPFSSPLKVKTYTRSMINAADEAVKVFNEYLEETVNCF